MYCFRCGQRLADSAKHCPNCGAAIFYNENGAVPGETGKDCDACAEESFGAAYSFHDPDKTDTGKASYTGEKHYEYDPVTGSYRSTDDGGGYGENGFETNDGNYHYGGAGQSASGYPYGSYRQPGGGMYPSAPTKQDGFALAALICGIASFLCCCVPYIGLPFSIAAVVLGILGRKSGLRKSMAVVGLVLGAIMFVVNGVMLALTIYYAVHPDLMEELMDQMQLFMEDVPASGELPIQ